MRLRHHADLRKTLAFAAIHLAIAVSVGYAVTGSFVLAGLLTLVEPLVNTVAYHALNRRWRSGGPLRRTLVFGAVHLAVAVVVGYALTGSLVLAGLVALVEPAANMVAHWFFERWWSGRPDAAAPVATPA